MRIATSSVRSIRKRLPAVLQWLVERKPYIVALQKISVSEAAFPTRVLEENGYHSAAFGPTGRTDYGVAVLSRRELPKPVIRFRGLPCPEANGARLLTVDIGEMRFSSIYAPYGNPRKHGNEKAIERRVAWLRRLREHVEKEAYAQRQSLLCGDFNVIPDGPPRPGSAYSEREQNELARLCELGFVDLYRRAHPGENTGFTFGFQFLDEGTSRLHLVLGSKSIMDRLRDAWVDLDYRRESAPVIVDLDGVTA
ncbi:MAG: exodeoxyribonuclease III [Gammaproteobacteria bacterium]|nr:exodeoxyribonuclease III [Gammaproteobacteria bacterium]